MESCKRKLTVIDTLDNVNFTTVRPVAIGTKSPKGRPDTTDTTRHVGHIEDEETFIPRCLTGQSHTASAATGGCRLTVGVDGVNFHVKVGGIVTDKTLLLGLLQGQVANED